MPDSSSEEKPILFDELITDKDNNSQLDAEAMSSFAFPDSQDQKQSCNENEIIDTLGFQAPSDDVCNSLSVAKVDNSSVYGKNYPIDAFPTILKNTICALHEDTQVPIQMIGSIVLASASLACQSLIEVIPPYSNEPEQCSLYFLTIAESGEGKTAINEPVMKPFYDFSSKMREVYNERLAEYRSKHDVWKIKHKALSSRLTRAIKEGKNYKAEEGDLYESKKSEPQKPKLLNIIYEDATSKAMIQGLNESPNAGVISDEAMIFFSGYAKNNLGLFNKSWGGETYIYRRPDGESIELKACLTLSLMVQPKIFESYLNGHGKLAESSGFFSRFLFSKIKGTMGPSSANSNHDKSDKALSHLYSRVNELLEEQKNHFYDASYKKQVFNLSDGAKEMWRERVAEIKSKATGHEHVKSIALKAGSNIIRIASILRCFDGNKGVEIQSVEIQNAYEIVRGYLNQANELFYPLSEDYAFEENVYELFNWIKSRFIKTNSYPILKHDFETSGIYKLRRVEKLMPVLYQLVFLGLICIIKPHPSSAQYIARVLPNGNVFTSSMTPQHSFIMVATKYNTPGRQGNFDYEKLQY